MLASPSLNNSSVGLHDFQRRTTLARLRVTDWALWGARKRYGTRISCGV